MRVLRITSNLPVADIDAANSFYTDFLGLSTEEFNLGWVARYTDADTDTDDLEAAYAEAQRAAYAIVHPPTVEPWGVRRLFVRAPDGNVLNIVGHRA
jgi:catechol 2,3-dioxygenase-like lactoylglutathione lyase family enzyme